jgi:hypothetical protein
MKYFLLLLFFYTVLTLETVTVDINGNSTPDSKKTKNEFFEFLTSKPDIMEVSPNTVELRENNGLSLFSTRAIKKDEFIFKTNITQIHHFISKRLFLEYAKNLPQNMTKIPQNSIIALLMIYEKHKCTSNDTLWKRYIEDIENRFPNYFTLLLYSEKDLEEFQSSISKQLVQIKLDEMADQLALVKFHKIYEYLDFGENCASNWTEILDSVEWIWGYTFSTRTFNINTEKLNITNELTIIPLVDFLNTAPESNVEMADVPDTNQHIFGIKASRNIKENEELTIHYPDSNNYLSNYGFCLEDNQHSFYSFLTKIYLKNLIKELKHEKSKEFLENYLNKNHQIQFINLRKDSKLFNIPQDLYSFLRLFHFDVQENIHSEGEIFMEKMRGKRLNYENEVKMLNSMLDLFKTLLSSYKTTLKEDQELLKKRDENYKVHCAIVVRRDEKIILENIIGQLEEVLKYSEMLKNPKFYENIKN